MEVPELETVLNHAREAARDRSRILCSFLLTQTELDEHPTGFLENVGRNLLQSTRWQARYQGSWALSQAALRTTEQNHALELLQEARDGFQLTEEVARSPQEFIKSRYVQAFLPTFKEVVKGSPTNKQALVRRLLGVNTAILGVAPSEDDPSFKGIVAEVNVATVLAIHSKNTNSEQVPWLSMPWQDSHARTEWTKFNTDLYYARTPDDLSNPIQVKSRISEDRLNSMDIQQGYHQGMTLIFGDVHLGNPDDDPLHATRILVKAESAQRQHSLQVMTANIWDELNATKQRVYGNHALTEAA